VSRRALLGGAAAAVAGAVGMAGCASSRSSHSGAGPTTVSATPSGAASGPVPESDRAVALDALADEQKVLGIYRALTRSYPRARRPIAALIVVQKRHVDALIGALEIDAPPMSPAVDIPLTAPDIAIPAWAWRAARNRLADCTRVESGSLASMLASMAASHSVVAAEWTTA
jgi:hypothetical protein